MLAMVLPRELTVPDELAAFAGPNEESEAIRTYLDTYTDWARAMDEAAVQLRELDGRLTSMRNKGGSLLDAVRAATANGAHLPNLDELITHCEQLENKMRSYSLPIIEKAKARKAAQFSLPFPRADRSKAIAIYEKAIRVHIQALEYIRDLRWQLMALRAASEPLSGSPIFSDSRELKSHLDKL
jgi:hypothetical protein